MNAERGNWLTRREAADFLASLGVPIKPKTLANMAYGKGPDKGPRFVSSGWRTIRYSRTDLGAWAASRRRIVNAQSIPNLPDERKCHGTRPDEAPRAVR